MEAASFTDKKGRMHAAYRTGNLKNTSLYLMYDRALYLESGYTNPSVIRVKFYQNKHAPSGIGAAIGDVNQHYQSMCGPGVWCPIRNMPATAENILLEPIVECITHDLILEAMPFPGCQDLQAVLNKMILSEIVGEMFWDTPGVIASDAERYALSQAIDKLIALRNIPSVLPSALSEEDIEEVLLQMAGKQMNREIADWGTW